MRRYILCSLVLFGFIGCASTLKDNNATLKQKSISIDNNKSVVDTNSTLLINLDEKLKKDYTKGGLIDDRTIPIDISEYQNPNDEVKFVGEVLQKVKTIKFTRKTKAGPNDEVSFDGKELKIKTAQLEDEDIISLVDEKDEILLNIKIRTY